jgi:hypothetical protein
MKRLGLLVGAWVVVALIAASVAALEIDVAPKTLALKSNGGQFTVHTDVPYTGEEDVILTVNETEIGVRTFYDDLGYLVAQCSKDAVKAVIGVPEDPVTTADAMLSVDGDTATEQFVVRK